MSDLPKALSLAGSLAGSLALSLDDYEGGALRKITGPSLRPGGLALTKRVLDFCRFDRDATLLDAGCGPGATLELLSSLGFKPIGVETSKIFAEQASRFGVVHQSSISALPLSDDFCDGIFCECVLNLCDRRSALSEFFRVLKPGGFLAISDVMLDGKDPSTNPRRCGCVDGAVSKDELFQELLNASFELSLMEDHKNELRSLAASLLWHYGPKGLEELTGGVGCRKNLTYILVIAKKVAAL
ncbi:MAG: class I SAM-dependent methyltransferase [Deltaproteobacteria bacterium]|jgi:SAM-dependent methyltransferase|nr:class I SAM-dependent methyltransferase [Deltaproteobacteria bacterium]